MAIMIPDTCPSRAQQGEKGLYKLLRQALPGNFMAWYEPVIRGHRPDFTLLADDFGLLILEVKDWHCGSIAKADNHRVEYHKVEDGQTSVISPPNPILQARGYFQDASRELSRPEYAILHHTEGKYRGKLCFPIAFGVVFTNITRAQLDAHNLSALFPPERVLCRDELRDLAGATDQDVVIRRLKRLFEGLFPFDLLTIDQIDTIRGVIHPEVVVKSRPATTQSVAKGNPLPPGATSLVVLDTEQEQLARALGEGHYLLCGVTGSGKTTLILARARALARREPSHKILMLCYNTALAFELGRAFKNDPDMRNIEVRNFHKWMNQKSGKGGATKRALRNLRKASCRGNDSCGGFMERI